ncbi:SusC/RagA family TonB-linked outer membrane protein [Capnocytophaga sp. oral taxon 903]|uniref:SusC/RagA family TonB-linked outer membrane protein n=1 Tax=Capnocytophaga sp. oral taxon 903 TaxID=2748317 RepID=UPI0021027EF9|nr:SusC/RagA family TonB-linked outer membrane protein [Capnocytophaga sp. oral taxon 903]
MRLNKVSFALFLMLIVQGFSWAQEREVTGTVKDEAGTPLAVVTVVVKGTSYGVATDFNGNYSIKVPNDKAVLVFSQIGMKTVEKAVGKARSINVILREEAQELTEVVVTGVGVATDKRKVAISVDAVSEKSLKRTPVKSIDDALSGKIAGAQIQSTSGQPGQQANIILRGINSLSTTQPMIIVDGVEVNSSNYALTSGSSAVSSRLADLDLSNVERVEVIQGAAAATIYGAQGANGVIQIFTKKGKKGERTEITYNSSLSVDEALTGNLSFAQKHPYKTDKEGYIIDGQNKRPIKVDPETGYWTKPDPTIKDTTANIYSYKEKTYDHLKQYYKTAYTTQHSVNITGSAGNVDYAIGASLLDQTSPVNGSYKKKNLSANVGVEVFKGLTLRSNTQLINSKNTTAGVNGRSSIYSGVGGALGTPAYVDLHFRDTAGKFPVHYDPDSNEVSPFYIYENQSNLAETNRVIQSINANYKFSKNLDFDYKYGYDHTRYDNSEFIKNQKNTNTPGSGISPLAGQLTERFIRHILQNSLLSAYLRLDFQRDLKLKLPIQSTTQLSYDWRKDNYYRVTATGSGYGVEPPFTISSANTSTSSDFEQEFVTFGYLVNQKFDYANLFGVSVGVRSDFSSAFGEGGKPFTFPRADAYFRIADLLKLEKVTELKLRGAYGEAGIQPDAYDRLITLSNDKLGDKGYYYLPTTARNPELEVQKSKELEVGLDYGFRLGEGWFHRISGNIVYWDRKSFGTIYNIETPPSLGAQELTTNAIDLSSNGLQASLDLGVLSTDKVDWTFSARFSKGETVVDKISNGKRIVVGITGGGQSTLNEGERVGTFFGYKPLSSLTQTNSKGERYIADADLNNYQLVNGMVVNKQSKEVIFSTEQEKMGDATPDFTMSFFNDITFAKKLTFSVQVDWTKGGDIYNGTKQRMYFNRTHGDLDTPIPVDKNLPYTNYYVSLYNKAQATSYFIEDGSYVRVRNVSLSYDMTDILKDTFIKGLTLTASVRNLITFTNYSGLDPEAVGVSLNNPLYRGIDLYTFPNMRTVTMALNVRF